MVTEPEIVCSAVSWRPCLAELSSDVLSGYRVLSNRFVKSYQALSGDFGIETELTVHALDLGLPIGEVETPYYPRSRDSPLGAMG